MNILRSNRFRRLSKEASWMAFGQLAIVFGSLVGVRILTELLDTQSYGELALGLTVFTLISQIILGPLSNGAVRFYAPASEQNEKTPYFIALRRLVKKAIAIIVFITLIADFILLIVNKIQWIVLIDVTVVFSIFFGLNSIISGVQNAARQRAIVAIHKAVLAWGRYLIAAGIIALLGSSSKNAMIGYSLASLLVLVSQSFFFRKLMPLGEKKDDRATLYYEKIFKYSWPFSAWGIFMWLQVGSDRWALELLSTTQEVGLYSALFQLGYQPITLASELAMQFISPIFFQRAGDAKDVRRNANVSHLTLRLTLFVLFLTGIIFILAILLHEKIFYLFVTENYRSVSYLLPWMLLGGGLFAAGQTITLNLMSLMKTKMLLQMRIVTALVGVGLNFCGAYLFSIKGIVGSIIIFSFIVLVWNAVMFYKHSYNAATNVDATVQFPGRIR